jgi:hypothetical protein
MDRARLRRGSNGTRLARKVCLQISRWHWARTGVPLRGWRCLASTQPQKPGPQIRPVPRLLIERLVERCQEQRFFRAHNKWAGVGRGLSCGSECKYTFTSSSDPKNPANAWFRWAGRRRDWRKSRARNWSVKEMTAVPRGRYSCVPCAQASPGSGSIHSAKPMPSL